MPMNMSMTETIRLPLAEVHELAVRVLARHGMSQAMPGEKTCRIWWW